MKLRSWHLSSRGAIREVIRGHQRSSEVIAPFVEWHAVVTRTPEEVEDGLVLMRDAIRDDYGARMFLIGSHQRQSEAIREVSTERPTGT